MDIDALIELLQQEVKSLTRYLAMEDYENSVADAIRETGWRPPFSTDFRAYWIKQRAKRHIFFYLMSESAHKFKFEQINLQHRFEHYYKLIQTMDTAFMEAKEEFPDEFVDADNISAMFGSKIDAGFSYSPAGEDTTYFDDNFVSHT